MVSAAGQWFSGSVVRGAAPRLAVLRSTLLVGNGLKSQNEVKLICAAERFLKTKNLFVTQNIDDSSFICWTLLSGSKRADI